MRPQTVFQLFVHALDRIRDLRRFESEMPQDIINGFFGNNVLIFQSTRALFSQHDRGHADHGLFKHFLIAQLALANLFVKPTQLPHLLNRWK